MSDTDLMNHFVALLRARQLKGTPVVPGAGKGQEISEAGWHIRYCLGTDAEGPYLDYYASHRMTDDEHVRLRPDGTQAQLPAYSTINILDADPATTEQSRRETQEHNRRVSEELRLKGFANE